MNIAKIMKLKSTPLIFLILIVALLSCWTTVADAKILHSFSGPDGNEPTSLLKTEDGTLWGVTFLGGSAGVGDGVLYTIDRAGTFTIVHTFTNTPDGSEPGRLIRGSDGSIYGLTGFGGANSSGTVYRVDLAGNYSIVHSFNGTTEGANPNFLMQASNGFFYGTTSTNGTAPASCANHAAKGTLFRMDVAGNVTPLHTFCESIDGSVPNSVLEAQDGFLYGTCAEDGPLNPQALGLGTLWKSTKAGKVTLLHVFGPTMANGAQPNEPNGIIQAADGFFYGTAHGGSMTQGAIFRADTAGNVTTIHSFNTYGSDGIDPDSDLFLGQDGFFFGTARQGGLPINSFTAGVVYRADNAGHVWVLHTFKGSDGSNPVAKPVLGPSGKIVYATAIFRGPLEHGVTISIPLKANVPIVGLAFNPNPVTAGQSTTGTLTLAEPAGPAGQKVKLFSPDSLSLPATVTVPAGHRVVTFRIDTQPPSTPGTGQATVTVTAYFNSVGMSSPLTIVP